MNLNFSKKIRNVRSGRKLSEDELPEGIPTILTKRMVMSQLNSIFDPLGLLTPFTVRGKIFMRNLWLSKNDWDDPLIDQSRLEWINFFEELFQASKLTFKRCIKPYDAIGDPILILLDASEQAYGTSTYARWQLRHGSFASCLLTSKGRISPLKTETVVRLELAGAVLSKRIRSSITKYSRLNFTKVIHIVGSEIVRAMINKESYGFNTFVATRVGEIQNATDISEWFWIKSESNIADILTKHRSPSELDSSSECQCGPKFLKLPIDKWPIRNDCSVTRLPEETKSVLAVEKQSCQLIDINRFSNYNRLIRTTARVVHVKTSKPQYSLSYLVHEITAEGIESAISFWTAFCQGLMKGELEKGVAGKGQYKNLNLQKRSDGIFIVKSRTGIWNELPHNDDVPILSKSHRLSLLYAEHVHRSDHLGVSADVAKGRAVFWIVGIERMMKSIRYKCIPCKKMYGK